MRAKHAVAVAMVLATVGAGAGSAQAAGDELSVTQRLQDRREVAAGTRAQVLGFQDGRFYANGWHTTGEMGGIVTPPLKLLDSLSFGVDGEWIGPASRFTAGWGYTRYDLPETAGVELSRTDVVPDGHRGALIGLELRNPARGQRTVEVMVDAHSELLSQYPWGFSGTVPNASDNAPDTGAFDGRRLVFRDTGQIPGEDAPHDYTALVGSDRKPDGGETGPGHYGPFGQGRECVADPAPEPAPMPSECDDGPFGEGTGGQLRYRVKLKGHRSETLWIAVAGSDESAGDARKTLDRLTHKPERLAAEKAAARKRLARWSRVSLPGDRRLQESVSWGKQNLADLTQEATDLEIRWTDEGRQWTFEGDVPRIGWVGAGFPDYPWLFGTDGEYTTHASVAVGQFDAIKDHLRALRDVSEVLSDGSGVVVHEVVADGSVWHGKDLPPTVNPDTGELVWDFNTDETVKFPGAVALVWRWTGDDAFRDEMLDFMRRNLEYVRTKLDTDGDGWPEGNGNVERTGMGEEKLDNAVYYIRGLYDYADMARSAGETAEADGAEALADDLASRFEETWWSDEHQDYADSLREPGNVKDNQRHWIGSTPMEVELYVDGAFVPGLAQYERGVAALATRETPCYSGERPGSRGLFHTGCTEDGTGGESAIYSLGTGVQAVGEGNYGRTGPDQRQRYTDANAETQFGQIVTGGTPDEQPGAMPEIFASFTPAGVVVNPPNIDRCWTCRSMFMQSWGHYGTAWSVVHQQLGVRPDLGHRRLEVVPQVPDGQPSVSGADIRLGDGSADVLASHDGDRYTTVVDTDDAPVRELWVGHTLPRGSTVAGVWLDGRRVDDANVRKTNRGVEVTVEARARDRHVLVVTAG